MPDEAIPPQLELVLVLKATVGSALELGHESAGTRRTVPILGGTFNGALSGMILPGGADWQMVEDDGLTMLEAQYVLETDDGVRIEIRNRGVRHGAPDVMHRLAAGEPVAPSEYYFRTTPRFYPPDGKYSWLKRSVFIASGERFPDVVVIRVWRVQ